MAEDIIIPVSLFLATFGIFYVFLTTRNKERLAMIERGFDPAKFKERPKNQENNMALKISLLLIGVALGIFLGAVFSEYMGLPEEAAYFSLIFFFGGLGLLVSHLLIKKEEKESK